ncbi:hypothetical protein GH714_019124 [Hevea brasiliensis]|uniref:S-locus receptor kinase C-terminal domain-containing protein n=1 Tax=Hevea brasiliensis TaxID=3981 RepID=A0A6A6LSV3_HEVBR|nr:hypothetical protein GH714_019124 [Hevea brasiliensis]
MRDEELANSFSSSEVTRHVNIGLLCVQDHVVDRPTMPTTVPMLSGEAKLACPKQPTFTFQNILHCQVQSENRFVSINEDHAVDRPTMPTIVSMLSGEAKLAYPKQPTFTFQNILHCQVQSENRFVSINEVTETESIVEGR